MPVVAVLAKADTNFTELVDERARRKGKWEQCRKKEKENKTENEAMNTGRERPEQTLDPSAEQSSA
jgi:hypothetical protein